MVADKSDLTRLPSQKLVEKYHELGKRLVEAHREQRRRKFREQSEGKESKDTSMDVGASVIQQAREVRAEIERRVREGDVDLYAMGAENLKVDFKGLPELALPGVETRPQNVRDEAAPQPSPSPILSKKRYTPSPNIAMRRAIVKSNPDMSARQLCAQFDEERISLPVGWEEKYGVSKWVPAYNGDTQARENIQRIISTDKKQDLVR